MSTCFRVKMPEVGMNHSEPHLPLTHGETHNLLQYLGRHRSIQQMPLGAGGKIVCSEIDMTMSAVGFIIVSLQIPVSSQLPLVMISRGWRMRRRLRIHNALSDG
jgi:hypothetical protein